MFLRVVFVLGCLVIPIVWGVGVHRLFEFWQTQRRRPTDDEQLPDFQI